MGIATKHKTNHRKKVVMATDQQGVEELPSPNESSKSRTSTCDKATSSSEDAALRKEFDTLDKNKTGYIDLDDLTKLSLGKIKESVLKKAIKFLDKDGDGKISFDEYKYIRNKIGDIGQSVAQSQST